MAERDVLFVRDEEGQYFGHITESEGVYTSHGPIGEGNEYPDMESVMQDCLTGHGLNIDRDLYWENSNEKIH